MVNMDDVTRLYLNLEVTYKGHAVLTIVNGTHNFSSGNPLSK
jgi:hypothetical protein